MFATGLAAGLVAGGTSCTAVQGGLLVGLLRTGPARTAPQHCRSPRERGEPQGPSVLPSPRAIPEHGSAVPEQGRVTPEFGQAAPDPALDAREPVRADMVAVGAFLGGRSLSHILAGALLGLVGSAVQLGPSARAALLVAAGVATVALAVRLLRRREPVACATHHAGPVDHTVTSGRTSSASQTSPAGNASARHAVSSRLKSAPTGGVWRQAALGAVTVLVPCGMTLSVEVLAVSSGSATAGAAAMAGFVLGTAPAFAALGLLLRRLTSTRLTALAGVAALVMGLLAVSSGLRLGGWLPEVGTPEAARARVDADGTQLVTIWATAHGFRPGLTTVEANHPIEIVFRTEDNHGCTRTIAVQGRDIVLPVTGQEVVRLAPQEPGSLRYACGMGMYLGFLRVE